jgi:hypothetical protein
LWVLIREGFLSRFATSGWTNKSYVFPLTILEVIKDTITSDSPLYKITAGLRFVPFKLVNGKGISTISPFFTSISELDLNHCIIPVPLPKIEKIEIGK